MTRDDMMLGHNMHDRRTDGMSGERGGATMDQKLDHPVRGTISQPTWVC